MPKLILAYLLAVFFIGQSSIVRAATIVVVGQGEVSVAPDTAKISIQVQGKNKNAVQAKTQYDAINKKLLADLTKLGIEEKDILQSYYTFSRDENRLNKESGYYISSSLVVKISNFDLLPDVIALAVADGAANVGQPEYSIADEVPLREKARAQAYQEAKAEAEKSAKVMGLNLGKIIKVSVGAASLSNVLAENVLMGGGMSRNSVNLDPQLRVEPVKVQYFTTVEYELQ